MNELFGLEGRTALITGGGTGLGRSFAKTLSKAGARVVICGRRVEPLEATVADIEMAGGTASCLTMDVTDPHNMATALDQAASSGRIDILVNNAGVAGDQMLITETEDGWDRIMNANLKGAFMLAQAVARKMSADKKGGSIINISSILASTAQKGTGPYAASKAALSHLTRNMAIEWGRYNIRVNAIAPGYFRTDMADDFADSPMGEAMIMRAPIRRFGAPDELSGAILLLASDAGAYMTGSVVTVDGGLSIPQI